MDLGAHQKRRRICSGDRMSTSCLPNTRSARLAAPGAVVRRGVATRAGRPRPTPSKVSPSLGNPDAARKLLEQGHQGDAMVLIVRTFRARHGHEAELLQGLTRAATGMVRHPGAGPVVICCQTNAPELFLWIGDRGSESDFMSLPVWQTLIDLFERSLLGSSPPLVLGLLDEFYRFPSPPYEVWSLEVHAASKAQPGILRDLFDLTLVARRAPQVAGMSLYRAVDEPGAFVGFLGLTSGFTPGRLLRNGVGALRMTEEMERAVTWRPLSVAWASRGRRPGPGTGAICSPAPFWVRSNAAAISSLARQETAEAPIETHRATGG